MAMASTGGSIKPMCNALSLPITYLPCLSSTTLNTKPCVSIRSRSLNNPSLILARKKSIIHVAAAAAALEEDDDGQFDNPEPTSWDADADADADADVAEEVSEPPEDAKLFVGNLPYDVDSERLAQLFEPAGVVEISEVIYNRETDQSRGFGFVTMSTVEEAEKAVEMFNRYDLNGRFLTVNKAAARGTRPERPLRTVEEASCRIYVGNLSWDVDNSRLEEVFSQYGNVESARVVFDRETGRSRGFGFVTMSSDKEVNDAIAALDGQTVDGRTVRVNVAEERPRRNF